MYRQTLVNSFASSASSGASSYGVIGQSPEQGAGPVGAALGTAGHDLGQLEQFGHRLALGDPLRAECDIDLPAELGDYLLDKCGHTRVHRAAQDYYLAVSQVFSAL